MAGYTNKQLAAFLGRPNAAAEIDGRINQLSSRLGRREFTHKHVEYREKLRQLAHLQTVSLTPPAPPA